jgi:hypothetical protein
MSILKQTKKIGQTKNEILSDFKIFANHNLLSLALTINKIDDSIKNKIIEDYESIISFFNDKEFNEDKIYSNWDDAFLSSSYGNWDAYEAKDFKLKKGRGRPKKVK